MYMYVPEMMRYNIDDEKAKVKNKEIMKKLKGHHVIRTLETNICGF